MVTYMFDAMAIDEAALMMLWITLIMSVVAFIVDGLQGDVGSTSMFFSAGLLLNIATFLTLLATWASLHLPAAIESLPVARRLEMVLMSCLPIPSSLIITFGALSLQAVSPSSLAYVLLGLMILAYELVVVPLPSSYLGAGRAASSIQARSTQPVGGKLRPDSAGVIVPLKVQALHMLCLLVMPALYHATTFRTQFKDHQDLVWDLVLLLSLAILYNSLGRSTSAVLTSLGIPSIARAVVAGFSAVMFAIAFEARLLSHVLSPLLFYRDSHPTFSRILLILAQLFGLAGLQSFFNKRQKRSIAVGERPMNGHRLFFWIPASSTATAMALGWPVWSLPLIWFATERCLVFLFKERFFYHFVPLTMLLCMGTAI